MNIDEVLNDYLKERNNCSVLAPLDIEMKQIKYFVKKSITTAFKIVPNFRMS